MPPNSSLNLDLPEGSYQIRVISNWGDKQHVGLSHLEALDQAGELLPITPSALTLRGVQDCSSLSCVVSGKPRSTSDDAMWLATPTQRADGCGFEPFDLVLDWPQGTLNP